MVPLLLSAARKQSMQRAVTMLELCAVLPAVEKMQILAVHLKPDTACRITLPASLPVKYDVCRVVKAFDFTTGIPACNHQLECECKDARLTSEVDLFISKRASIVDEFIAKADVIHSIRRPRWLVDAENIDDFIKPIENVSPTVYREYLETRS